jgi:hypothetical protein
MKKPPILNAIAGGPLMARAIEDREIPAKARAVLLRQWIANHPISKEVLLPRGVVPATSNSNGKEAP